MFAELRLALPVPTTFELELELALPNPKKKKFLASAERKLQHNVHLAPEDRTQSTMARDTETPYKLDKPEKLNDLLRADGADDCAGCRIVGM